MQEANKDTFTYIQKFNDLLRPEARNISVAVLFVLLVFSIWDIQFLGLDHPAVYPILWVRFGITLPLFLILFFKSYQSSPVPRLDLWTCASFSSVNIALISVFFIYHNVDYKLPLDSILLCSIILYFLPNVFYYQKLFMSVLLVGGYLFFLIITDRPEMEFVRAAIYLFVLNLAGVVQSVSFDKERKANFNKTEFLRHMAQTDQLTGAENRHKFDERFTQLLSQAKNDNLGIAVAIVDIDWFKQYNDHYGHFAGDECLIRVAQAFLLMKRHPLDSCIRFGGEEFILIKYGVSLEQSAVWGQKIIDTIYQLNIPHATANDEQRITVSAGVIHWHPTSSLTRTQLMTLADEALYKAKENGRNQVQLHLSKTR